jgi:hypothetical protein
MSSIQEIAEELVNLSVKEVNELAMIMKHDNMDIPQAHYEEPRYNKLLTPKQYGQRKIYKRRKV